MKEILKLELPMRVINIIQKGIADKVVITKGHREVTISFVGDEYFLEKYKDNDNIKVEVSKSIK